MKFTNIENGCFNLRRMGKQVICPGDEFFGPLADAIEKQERTLEACRRYFEHCNHVSIASLVYAGKGCDSPEMSARMALYREARDAIG